MSATFDDSELDSEFPQDVIQDLDNEPHVRIPISILQAFGKQLGATGIAVYVGVKSHANRLRGNSTFILVKTLAEELGMGESTVRRELLKCERLGLLKRNHRLGKSTIYFITPVLHLIEEGLLPNRTLPSIREKYNYKNLTTTPSPTPSSSDAPMLSGDVEVAKPPKKRRSRNEIVLGFSEGTREVVNTGLNIWPKVRRGNKSPIHPDVPLFASRIEDILRDNSAVTPAILIGAMNIYLAENKEFPHSPEFFFGPGKPNNGGPPWLAYARMAWHNNQKPQAKAAVTQ